MAALFLVLTISLPTLRQGAHSGRAPVDFPGPSRVEREGSDRKPEARRPAPNREPIQDVDSRAQAGVPAQVMTLSAPDSKYQASDASPSTMIARTVSLSIVVKDFALCRSSIDAIVERHHGYPEQLDARTPQNAPRTLAASLRIPAPRLAQAVGDLKALGRVENESQSGEEVTTQHTDLLARLKNSRDTEQRLRAILQQRAGNVAEVLQVEEEIARVRGDIERMEGEQKSLEHRVEFAAVELEATEEYQAPFDSPAASVSTRMHNAFVAGYHHASETVFGVVLFLAEYGPAFLIWILILALPGVLLWRRYRRALAAV